MIINDIGTAWMDNPLLCHTNHPADIEGGTDGIHSGGAWFTPNHTEILATSTTLGFRRNLGFMVVRLIRYTASTSPPVEGIYRCEVMDATDTLQTVYVGLYNENGGGNVLYM